jgi:hypothetical protein
MSHSAYTHQRYGPVDSSGLKCFRSWSSDPARKWVEALLDEVRANERFHALVAVGSSVRARFAADLDFLLIFDPPKPSFNDRPIDVDFRCFQRSTVDSLIAEGHELLGWAVLYGCPVFDRAHFWHRLCLDWRGKVPLPSADVARKRAAKAREHLTYLLEAGDEDAAQEQRITVLTHLARAELIDASVFPASRPELPSQLKEIGSIELATELDSTLKRRELGSTAGRRKKGPGTAAVAPS